MAKTPIDYMLDGVEWKVAEGTAQPGDLPHVTHYGVLEIFDTKMRCYRLSSGQAVIHSDDLDGFLDSTFSRTNATAA